MAGPPKDITPSALWLKLASKDRPRVTIEYPHNSHEESPGDVALWVLTEQELHQCRANADKVAKSKLNGDGKIGDLGYEEIYRNEILVQLVWLACRQPDDPQFPIFATPDHVRQRTSDEIAVLVNAYNEHSRTCGPILSELTPEELEAWTKMLAEGASRHPLAALASEAKTDLILHLVSLLPKSETDNG